LTAEGNLLRQNGLAVLLGCDSLVGMSWKPIVWNRAEHYGQWLSYSARTGEPPKQGAELTLTEHPGRVFVATGVEGGVDSVMVWLKPLEDNGV
jgi:hypothetical protein